MGMGGMLPTLNLHVQIPLVDAPLRWTFRLAKNYKLVLASYQQSFVRLASDQNSQHVFFSGLSALWFRFNAVNKSWIDRVGFVGAR